MKTFALFVVLTLAGEPIQAATAPPAWLQKVIQRNFPQGKETKVNPPEALHIYRYKYRNQDVYYIPSRCCDIRSTVYDSSGKLLCSPDGGKTGQGDGKCADFFEVVTPPEIVWP